MKIVHWIPQTSLGGCEVILDTFIQGCPQYTHLIITGGAIDGPAVDVWKHHGAIVIKCKYWLLNNPFKWSREFKDIILSLDDEFRVIAWSPSRLPFLRIALKKAKCKQLLVHIGSRLLTPYRIKLIYSVLDLFYGLNNNHVFLIGCSNYVNESIKKDVYFSRFKSKGVLNGVRSIFTPIKRDLNNDKILSICTVSRLDVVKGHKQMIDYFYKLIKTGINANFDIIGEGDQRNNIEAQIESLGLENRIRLLGNRHDIHNILQNYDVFLFNSQPLEGMGIALAEAMVMGVVPVVNKTPLMIEMVGDTGFFFDNSKEFVQTLSILDSKRNILSQKSKETQERAIKIFAPEYFAKQYIDELSLSV